MTSTRELHGYPESDWRVFRQLREVALDRFCERVFHGMEALSRDTSRSPHERYLALFDWLAERNREMVLAFDDCKRSVMIPQLMHIRGHGLLKDEEFERFSPETQERIDGLVSELRRRSR